MAKQDWQIVSATNTYTLVKSEGDYAIIVEAHLGGHMVAGVYGAAGHGPYA